MTLFHGSNVGFDKVSLDFAKDRRDFRPGFYTTTIKEQVADWAENICRRYKTKTAYLYTFEFSLIGLRAKNFEAISRDWLDFIIENRILYWYRGDFIGLPRRLERKNRRKTVALLVYP